MSPRLTGTAWLVALVVATGGCDCEDQLRKLVSNSGDRRVPAKPQKNLGGPAESEPNDKPGQASPIKLGKEMRDFRGAISAPGDVDWFSVTSSAGPPVLVEVTPKGDLDISLHVEVQGGAESVYDVGGPNAPERIEAMKVGVRPQLFAVRSKAGQGDYTISFQRQLAAEGMETEPNDEASVATVLSLPSEIRGTYDRAEDRDVYRLTGDAQRPFVFEIGAVTGGRHMARIYGDEALQTPLMSMQIVEPVIIPNLVLDPVEPRFLVLTPIGQPRLDASYTLTAKLHPNLEEMLEAEPNDTTPMKLELGKPEEGVRKAVVAGYLHAADDRDQFVISPPEMVPNEVPIPPEVEGTDYLAALRGKVLPRVPVQAKVSWADPQSSLGLSWTGADGTKVEFRQTSQTTEVVACGLDLDRGPATVEVRAERLGSASSPGVPHYTLALEESSEQEAFEAEPNDAREKADVLESRRRGAFAVVDDADFFAFAVTGEASKHVKVKAEARGVDIVLKLTDDTGGILANVDNARIGSGEFVALDLPPGLYFAELRWNGGELCAPYEISLESQ